MRYLRVVLITLLLLLGLAGQGAGAWLPDFWDWGGPSLLNVIRGQINGKITAQEISGNPLTGITYKGLVIQDPQGVIFLEADRLEVRASLWSLATLRLDIARLALIQPRVYLIQEESGDWNFRHLLRQPAREQPSPPSSGLTAYFLREIDFSKLLVEKGEIVLRRKGITTYYRDLDLTSSIAIRHLNRPEQKIQVRQADLEVTTPQGRAKFDTRLAYQAGLATIDFLALQLAGQTVLSLKGELCQPLTRFTCQLTGTLGPLQGAKLHELWHPWPASWDLAAGFSFASSPEKMSLQAQGGVGQATFELKGQAEAQGQPAAYQLDATLKGLTTTQLQEIPGLPVAKLRGLSPVNAHLHLQGTGLPWNPESAEARLDLEPFQYQEVKVSQAHLALQGDAQRQQLQAEVKGNFGQVALKASGQLLPLGKPGNGLHGDLTVQTAAFQPSRLGLVKYPGTSLNSRFTGKFRLPPSYALSRIHLEGSLQANGSLGNKPLQDLQSNFVLEGDKLTLSRARLQMAPLEATLRGSLSRSGLDVIFTASLSGSRGLPLPAATSFGYLQAEGSVRGPWRSLQWRGLAKANRLGFPGTTLETASLTFTLAGWPPQSGQLQLQGLKLHTAGGTFSRLNFQARGEGGKWQFELAGTAPKYPKAELAGTADLNPRPLAVSIQRISWQSSTLALKNRAPFQVWLFPGWEISPATLQVDGGTVTVQALVRGNELAGRLEVQGLDAGLLQPAGLKAQGKLNGKLSLAGSPRAPSLDGRIELTSGRIMQIPLQTLTTTLNYREDRLQAAGYLEAGELRSRLTWNGSVPVHLSLSPWRCALGDSGLSLRLQSEKVNFCLLPAISKEVQSASGPVEMLVEAKGDPHQPQVSGHIRWGTSCLQLQQAGVPYELSPGEIRLQGSKIVIPGIMLISDGTIRLAGDISLSGPARAEARVQVNNFLVMNRGGNQIWTNGFIDLGGPWSALAATGRLVVPKAQLRPNLFRSEVDPDIVLVSQKPRSQTASPAPELYRNLRIDVTLESPGNVWLRDPVGQVEMTAHLKARKKPGQKLALGGQIRALQGSVEVQERPFQVERAILSLPGVPGEPIIVDGKATHGMDDVTLVLTVDGALTNPQIRLESLPPLPPADVLSYLVFGAPAATLTKEQYLALGVQSLGVLGGVTTKKMDEIVGQTIPFLKGLKVKSGTVSGRPTIGVAKEITKSVSVSYQRNLNEERGQYESQVGIEYKINKNWSVESQLGPRNSGADVYFNYDF